jgi:hypothetical protein
MTEGDRFTEEYLSEVMDIFQSHSDWELENESTDIDDIVESGAQVESPEFVYNHVDTTGSLHLKIPRDSKESVVIGNLAQFLDPDLPHDPNSGYLSEKLVTATQAIVSQQDSDLITSTENTYDVLFFDVPVDYQQEEFLKALDQASEASKMVQEMYNEIENLVEEYPH